MRLAAALCTGLFFFSTVVLAQVPRVISYQGVLTDTLGTPKPDGPYELIFRLYKAETGGTAIWSETKSLQLRQGLFSTMLGDLVPFPPSIDFSVPYWLSVQVGGDELSPRIRLGAVGYAIRAIRADTASFVVSAGSVQRPISPGISNAELADDAVTSAKILDGTITSADVAPTFKAPKADTASVALSSTPAGNAGGALSGTYPNPSLAADAVTSSQILDGSITGADVSASFRAPKADTADVAFVALRSDTATIALAALTSAPTGTAGGDLTGSFPNPQIASDAVTTSKIADGTITTADVAPTFKAPKSDSADFAMAALPAPNSVATSTLPNGAVTSEKLSDGTITTADLSSALVAPKADTASVALTALSSLPGGSAGGDLAGTYPNPSLADSVVTSSKIKDGAVTDDKITGVSSAKLSGALPALDASALTDLNAGNLTSGTVPGTALGGTYSNPLTLSNSGNLMTGKMLAIDGSVLATDSVNHRVGVGTTQPLSTLDVQGSFGLKTRLVIGPADVDAGNESVYMLDARSGAVTVRLPNPIDIQGRVYYFRILDSTNSSTLETYGGYFEGISSFGFVINDTSVTKVMLIAFNGEWMVLMYQQ